MDHEGLWVLRASAVQSDLVGQKAMTSSLNSEVRVSYDWKEMFILAKASGGVLFQLYQQLAEPDSASGVARRLGLPRQQVNYHLRELEKQGFLEFIEERRKGNCMERLVRATARTYLISPEALGHLGPTPEQQR